MYRFSSKPIAEAIVTFSDCGEHIRSDWSLILQPENEPYTQTSLLHSVFMDFSSIFVFIYIGFVVDSN